MSKAILVIDMPSRCNSCPLLDEPYDYCIPTDRDVSDYGSETKPTWCPLKEVPQKKEADSLSDSGYFEAIGYNACIDEILKGSEESE